jgi:putative oxygen-independent coproporphyrinogen III oxidase
MAGIYVHIPFCKSRCIYCDFYSTTFYKKQDQYVDALIKELQLRRDYLNNEPIETIYIGGGTPSLLSSSNITKLFRFLPIPFNGNKKGEITFECNPDDVTEELAENLLKVGVNRISMGAQSFSDARLKFLNRRHNSMQVSESVRLLRDKGIKNISIDLIFGFPNETLEEWIADIDKAIDLNVEHISAYSLMFEKGTPLYNMLKSGTIKEIDEDLSREMYYTLIDKLENAGYIHYEISNFARNGYKSVHNTNYWQETPYLGIGAGAHSYNKVSRQWNIEDIIEYINSIEKGKIPATMESIDKLTRYNDMITTSLRTRKGININSCGEYQDYLIKNAKKHIDNALLVEESGYIRLSKKGLFLSDYVMSDLIFID